MNLNQQQQTKKKNAMHLVSAIASLVLFLLFPILIHAQNVGVGLSNPLRKLSINGSLMVDQNNMNTGMLDSAALVFGSNGTAGILSKKSPGGNINGLSFFTNGTGHLHLSSGGHLGLGSLPSQLYKLYINNGNSYFDGDITSIGQMAIGGNIDVAYRLRVWDGASRFGGDLHATGNAAFGGLTDPAYALRVYGAGTSRFDGTAHIVNNMSIGGNPDANYRLRVHNGNTLLGGDVHATGNASIGGAVDNNFRLRVYGGNSRFGGDVEVTGDMTIGGKGSVRSNGPSQLRIGFDVKPVNVFIIGNTGVTIHANITDFSGDDDDVRVFLSQVVLEPGNALFLDNVKIVVQGVDNSNNTCALRITNLSNVSAQFVANLYLTTIAKN